MEIRKIIKEPQFGVALLLLVLGVALRFLPHEPNFVPIGAIAVFGGLVLGWRTALWLPLLIMIVSDLIIGFYPGIFFTWAGFVGAAVLGVAIKHTPIAVRLLGGGLGGATIFFIVSNFGVWVSSGMYALTLGGLAQCYYMALPFFRASLTADVIYLTIFVGVYALALHSTRVHAEHSAAQ